MVDGHPCRKYRGGGYGRPCCLGGVSKGVARVPSLHDNLTVCSGQPEVTVATQVQSTLQPEVAVTGNWAEVVGYEGGMNERMNLVMLEGRMRRAQFAGMYKKKMRRNTMRSPVDIATMNSPYRDVG